MQPQGLLERNLKNCIANITNQLSYEQLFLLGSCTEKKSQSVSLLPYQI